MMKRLKSVLAVLLCCALMYSQSAAFSVTFTESTPDFPNEPWNWTAAFAYVGPPNSAVSGEDNKNGATTCTASDTYGAAGPSISTGHGYREDTADIYEVRAQANYIDQTSGAHQCWSGGHSYTKVQAGGDIDLDAYMFLKITRPSSESMVDFKDSSGSFKFEIWNSTQTVSQYYWQVDWAITYNTVFEIYEVRYYIDNDGQSTTLGFKAATTVNGEDIWTLSKEKYDIDVLDNEWVTIEVHATADGRGGGASGDIEIYSDGGFAESD